MSTACALARDKSVPPPYYKKRTAALAALRAHLATLQDSYVRDTAASQASTQLAGSIARDGFEAGSKWIAAAGLTQQELTSIITGLNVGLPNSNMGSETGRWIEWAAANLPAGERDKSIQNLVSQWTGSDFQAVGKWINATPAGPTKTTSIRAYAETLSRYGQPAAAAQWAMTLPPGKDLDETLKQIHNNWPKNDPAAKEAAAAFAKEHGIK